MPEAFPVDTPWVPSPMQLAGIMEGTFPITSATEAAALGARLRLGIRMVQLDSMTFTDVDRALLPHMEAVAAHLEIMGSGA
jgi:hypothetical protein